MVIVSSQAVALVKLLNDGAWIFGTHQEFSYMEETITVIHSAKRCYIYGEQRKAMISVPRNTIENIERLHEEDVISILRIALERQSGL